MDHCTHNIPETKKGIGPCRIEAQVKKRNGNPNWWCRTHGLEAAGPDGAPLERCSGAWFEPVPADMKKEIDLSIGEVAIWGTLPPAIAMGEVHVEPGQVHVHRRQSADGEKDIDGSYDIVRVRKGDTDVTVEGMAARAFAVSDLTQQQVQPLECPHCGEIHIDELKFATHPHSKHLCNSCGRNFRMPLSISNPLGDAIARLGLPKPQPAQKVDRPLNISSHDYAGIALWPSNRAVISTMTRPEDKGIHVHAWSDTGVMVIDETYSPVILDGEALDEQALRMLAVQRTLAANDNIHIIALACIECGHSILGPTEGWIEPSTLHTCNACGTENRTRRRSFLNPLADKSA